MRFSQKSKSDKGNATKKKQLEVYGSKEKEEEEKKTQTTYSMLYVSSVKFFVEKLRQFFPASVRPALIQSARDSAPKWQPW
jgi:hypothetical protein